MPRLNDYSIRERLRATTAIASAVSLFVTQSFPAFALPQGGQVGGGQATITSGGGQMTIDQSSHSALINWNSFNIGGGESVTFNQPSSTAISLNRIHDLNPSQIDGALNANGQVWLINAQGIAFGAGAQVNVGGLLATTSDIDDDRFLNGDYTFDRPGNPLAWVTNAGRIHVADNGLAALVGANVSNSGLITARLGRVQLASGDTFALDLYGDGLINLEAGSDITSQLVSNSGTISAGGGHVLLTVAQAQDAVSSLVNMDGTIEADTVGGQAGTVTMSNTGGTTLVSGTVSARGNHDGEKGGLVAALGRFVGILSGASIDTSGSAGGGTILVGGDYLGQGAVPTAQRTIVQGTTNLYSNATGSGDGGKVIVWSDDRTDFAGSIEAKGGTLGGDGGFVETSGKNILSSTGNVDASSAWGRAGVWLLDPNNITIQAAGSDTNVTGNPNFTTTDDSAIVTTGSIQTALNAGTSVVVQTGTAGTNSQAGNITVADNVSKTAGGDATFTLSAANNILINSGVGITSSAGELNVVLNADADGSGAGAISMASGSSIVSNGGDITMGGGGLVGGLPSGAATGVSGNIYGVHLASATVNAQGGNISITGTGFNTTANGNHGILINSSTVSTSGSGNITLVGQGGGNTNSSTNVGVRITGAGASVTHGGSGNISITGTGGNNGGTSSGGNNHGVDIVVANGVVASGTGNIIIHGTGGNTTSGFRNRGVQLAGSITAGSGTISITGYSGNGGTSAGDMDNHGIRVTGAITGGGGDITLAGVGGNGVGNYNFGIELAGATISNTGAGGISVTGTGGGSGAGVFNLGVGVRGASAISTVDGDISFFGTGGNSAGGSNRGFQAPSGGGSPSISTSGSGNIHVAGIAGVGGTSMLIGGITNLLSTTGTGSITLRGDTMQFSAAAPSIINSAGNITITPYTSGTSMGIGSGAGTLQVSDTGLGSFTWGGMLTLGNASTGAMNINSAVAFANPVTFITGTGYDITLSGALGSSSAGTAFTLASGRNFINNAGASGLVAGSGRWLVYSNDPADDTLGGLGSNFTVYSCAFGGSCPAFPGTGNGFLYRVASAGGGGGGGGSNNPIITLPSVIEGYIYESNSVLGRMLQKQVTMEFYEDMLQNILNLPSSNAGGCANTPLFTLETAADIAPPAAATEQAE